MIRRPPRSTQSRSSAASDVYKRQRQPSIAPCSSEEWEKCKVKILLARVVVAELLADQRPQRPSKRPKAADCLAQDHYPQHTEQRGDCVVCSQQPENRMRSRIICAGCGVHLCIGECFSLYHAAA